MPAGGTSEEGEIAQEIEDLVAHELVLEPERLLVQDAVRPHDDGVLERAPLDHALRAEMLHVALQHERPRRRDLLHEDLGIDVVRGVLGAAPGVRVLDGKGDAEPVVRKRDQDHAVLLVPHRLRHTEVAPRRRLIDQPCFLEEAHVRRSASVGWLRRLLGVERDHEIVDAESGRGREDVLHRVHFGLAVLQDRAPHLIHVGARVARVDRDLGVTREVQPNEADPGAGWRGTELHLAGAARVEANPLIGDRLRDRPLAGRAHLGAREPSSVSTRRFRRRTVWMSSGRFRMLASIRFARASG
jgi:hypothetical protein